MALKQAEEEAGAEHAPRPPVGEDQRGERDVALPRRHVAAEAGRLRGREISAGEAAEDAGDDDRAVAKPGHRDARRVDRGGVLADGAEAQAEARAVDDPGGERHGEEGDIDDEVVAGDHVGIDRPEDRDVPDLGSGREVDRGEALAVLKLRRAPALAEPGLAEERGQPGGEEVDGDAGDDLVAALGDRGEAVHQREHDRDEDRRAEPEPGRAGERRDRAGGERADQHLSLEPDVENAGALGIETGERGEQQRRGQPHRGIDGLPARR